MPCTLLIRRHDTLSNVCGGLGSQRWLARPCDLAHTTRPQLKRCIRTKGPPPKRTPGDLHNLAQHIIPGSLTSTINIHRQANQNSKIRLIKSDTLPGQDEGQEDRRQWRYGGTNTDANRPMSLVSSLSESFRSKVSEEASKHALFNPKVSRVLSGKRKIVENARAELAPEHYHGQTYNGSLTTDEGRDLMWTRKALLQEYEKPSQEIASEDDWKVQMDILKRTRAAVYNSKQAIHDDDKFKDALRYQTILEYIGRVIPLVAVPPRLAVEPWACSSESRQLPGMQRLDSAIEAFMEWMDPTESEQLAREAIFDTTMELIRDNLPGFAAVRVGSQVTGLAMPTSDTDIRLFHPTLSLDPSVNLQDYRDHINKGMDIMFDILKTHAEYTLTEKVGGHYPVLNTTHKETGLSVQIVSGPSSVHSQKLVRKSLSEHPHLKTLFTIIKTALDMRGLSSVYIGGLGSYPIFNMVLAALNLHRLEHPTPSSPPTAATLLLYTLDFYANVFNPYAFAISASPFRVFRKRRRATAAETKAATYNPVLRAELNIAKPVHLEHYMLCLQDPADINNDLGRKSFAFKHVQATMKEMHANLTVLVGASKERGKARLECLLRAVVGRCDYVYDDRRARLELFGEECVRNPQPLYRVGPEGEAEEEKMTRWARKKRIKAEKRLQDEQDVGGEKVSSEENKDKDAPEGRS